MFRARWLLGTKASGLCTPAAGRGSCHAAIEPSPLAAGVRVSKGRGTSLWTHWA